MEVGEATFRPAPTTQSITSRLSILCILLPLGLSNKADSQLTATASRFYNLLSKQLRGCRAGRRFHSPLGTYNITIVLHRRIPYCFRCKEIEVQSTSALWVTIGV